MYSANELITKGELNLIVKKTIRSIKENDHELWLIIKQSHLKSLFTYLDGFLVCFEKFAKEPLNAVDLKQLLFEESKDFLVKLVKK